MLGALLGYGVPMGSPAAPDFYFDFISPYAYLAWRRWPSVLGVAPHPCPVVFGALLSEWGTLGPAEVPPKREFLIRDVARRARRAGLPLRWPPAHPWSPVLSLRLALPEVAGEHQAKVVDAIFRAAWEQGRSIADEAELRSILDAAGLASSLVDEAQKPAAKQALRDATAQAVARGVFGVPTIDLGDELFWGDDQLDVVAARLAGTEPPDEPWVTAALASSPAFVRPGAPTRPAASIPPARPPESSLTQEQAERVMGIFERSRFTSTLGLETRRLGEGRCDTELLLRPDHLQQDGVVHAGVQATMADHTAGAAALTMAPEGTTVLTIEFKVNLLRAARGERLRCEARVLRGGRRVSVVEADVHAIDKDGTPSLVSKAIVTLAIVEISQMKKE
jgi:uncharacterized protein (TIGR00369 family)